MAAPMKKMADEICGSLELMRGEGMGGEAAGAEGGRGGGVNPLFLSLLLLIKERYYTAACLFIVSVGGWGGWWGEELGTADRLCE